MVENVGFTVERMDVRGNRIFLEARRVVFDSSQTRSFLAHGDFAAQPRGQNPNDPASWIIF